MATGQHNPSETPRDLKLTLLEEITDKFSNNQKVGSGGFGDVYWGLYRDKKIAMKKLYDRNEGFDDEGFKKEFNNSMKLHHPNIVRLVGYCYEIRHRHIKIKGEYEFAKIVHRVLCFEYCQGGSLDKHIYEEFRERDLETRLKIIRGISEGLNYLHNGLEKHMLHLDLKPANILLDANNMPKICDFGLSRFLAVTQTQKTNTSTGTTGYMPPEYINEGKISSKFDVFSLGVIILQVLAVPLGYSKFDDMSPREFVEHVRKNWNQRPPVMNSSEIERVKDYIDIALRCVREKRQERPKISDIVRELKYLDAKNLAQHSVGPSRGPTSQATKISSKAIKKNSKSGKMNIVLLSQLHPSSFNSVVRVRISRMWEYRGTSDDGDVKHLDLIIVDEKKNSMYVEIPPDAIPILKPSLQEGRIITMRKFLVENAKPQFKVVDGPYMIKLNKRTEIAQVHPEPPEFPRYVYTITPIAKLPDHVNKKDKFLDVIGQVVAVSNGVLVRNPIGKQQMKRIVILRDENGNIVQVSLWGSRASEFNGDLVFDAGQKDPVIVIFVGTLFKSYKRPPVLSGTSACRWYINEDIPHINEFCARLPLEVEPVEKLQLDNDQGVPSEIQQKTVLQLKDICPCEQAGQKFECTITITRLSPNQTWLYPACRACRARSRLIGSTYKCNNEKCSCTQISYRYKLCLMGSDGTYELEFILFGNIAQQLIGKPIELLQSNYGMYDTPLEISSLVGQKYTFIVRISTRQTVKSKKDDPSFEVVSIAQQHGRKTILPTIRANEVLTGSSSSFLSVPRAPLVPVRSKTIQHDNTVIPPVQLQNENDAMEVEQTGNVNQQTLTGSKRAYMDILSHPQGATDDDQDDPNNNNPTHYKKGRQ